MDEKEIKNYWSSQADKYGTSPEASWGDYQMIDLEVAAIREHIIDGDMVLDVGCANGHAAYRQLYDASFNGRNVKIIGIDYSESMIKQAIEAYQSPKLEFFVGDAKEIGFTTNYFDVVYTTRTLINLPTWEEQVKAINECIRVCKPGGKILFSEAFYEPLQRLNAIRTVLDLPPLREPEFNKYLSQPKLLDYLFDLKDCYVHVEQQDISSVYYFGTRVLADYVGLEKGFDRDVNKLFKALQFKYEPLDVYRSNLVDTTIGVQQLVIVRKFSK